MSLFRSPRVWIGLFLALGLFASAYLLIVYMTGGPILCGSEGGCELVRASKWAYIGTIPRPALGLVFYVGMFALFLMRALTPKWQAWLRRLTFLGAAVGLVESVHLFFVQLIDIKAFCVWCIVSGIATLGVFVLSCVDRANLSDQERLNDLKGYTVSFFLLVIVGVPALLLLTR